MKLLKLLELNVQIMKLLEYKSLLAVSNEMGREDRHHFLNKSFRKFS